MTVSLPSSLPPATLYPKVLPHLLSQLTHSSPFSTTLPLLRTTLHILASLRLTDSTVSQAQSTVPLQSLLEFSTSHPGLLKVPILLDGIISYPLHIRTINQILNFAFDENPDLIEIFRIEILPSLINRLKSTSSTASTHDHGRIDEISKSVTIFLSVIRSHDELLALALEDSEDVLTSLSIAYTSIGNKEPKTKSDILMICKELLDRVEGHNASEEAMIKFMGHPLSTSEEQDEVLQRGSLRDDWESLFEKGETVGIDIKEDLERRRDDQAKSDLRVQSLLQLFPSLPPHLLLSALSHPTFSAIPEGSRATPSEQAAPLLETIFNKGEGLPNELDELKIAIQSLSQGDHAPSGPTAVVNGNGEKKNKFERSNIFNDELDISKLRLKDDESSLPTLSNTIPDTLRASIMRLVENQAAEEEERRLALKEANLLDDEDDYEEGDDGLISRVRVGGGTGDGETDELDEEDGIKISREHSGAATPSGPSDRQRLDILRTTYITNPKVFERDGNTRRSVERKRLREITAWDDGQIEGWRIMLERDPHKDDILAAHQERLTRNRTDSPARQNQGDNHNEGSSRGGRGGGGRGGQRGSGGGGRGGQRGGGGGRGSSKSSRGHSNAARTRGHDKKMGKMGAI
ncbi:uncharacterized protein IL334_002145 [Kwoniella shivajii]|uniref:CUE domain-containing protein n=1 Tax=Kwoniella shivajii TaxID=564305 RepID=A0ABZ1CY16_9TREE|nr:hypothetical protein IL334_002145 [Kwoniella shivajii]